VESVPGKGSTFIAGLPLSGETTVVTAVLPNRDFLGGTETLLVVDDEISLRRLLFATLTAKGYKVITASNGLEAIDFLSRTDQPLDAVLLDLNIPGANGLEVARVVKIVRPSIKVLVLSGNLHGEVLVEMQRLGLTEFVKKPYALDDLGRRLRVLLDAPHSS
jgi:DNA-binding response OmpR family regulator